MATLNEQLREVKQELVTVGLRHKFRDQKTETTRLMLLEDHVATIARAMTIFLDAHERGVL